MDIFPTLLACTALFLSVSGHPTSAENYQEHFSGTDSRQSDLVYRTPALVFIGKENGDILRCPYLVPDDCETYYKLSSSVQHMSVYGEFIYAILYNKIMVRCELNKANSCEDFSAFDSLPGSAIHISRGHILVGQQNGNVLRCSLLPNSCSVLYTFDAWINSVIEYNEDIYVSSNEKISRCSETDGCTEVLDENVGELSIVNNTIFGVSGNKLLKCTNQSQTLSHSCEHVDIQRKNQQSKTMITFRGLLYILHIDRKQPVIRCKWGAVAECSDYLKHEGALSLAFAYSTHRMKIRYMHEEKTCSWQNTKCPPFVHYYEAKDRVALEVHVKDGKLYNSLGSPLDTRESDEGESGPAAIFVMAPDGRLLVTKSHTKELIHASSLLAGNPISGAGKMVAIDGVIKYITACSSHYEPDLLLNEQVIQSLRYQGYTAPIESKECHEYNQLSDEIGT